MTGIKFPVRGTRQTGDSTSCFLHYSSPSSSSCSPTNNDVMSTKLWISIPGYSTDQTAFGNTQSDRQERIIQQIASHSPLIHSTEPIGGIVTDSRQQLRGWSGGFTGCGVSMNILASRRPASGVASGFNYGIFKQKLQIPLT